MGTLSYAKKARKLKLFDESLNSLASDMIETMYAEEGIGLAAQQIGLALQICVVDVRPDKESGISFTHKYDGKYVPLELFMPLAIINPKISIIDSDEDFYQEGCLSLMFWEMSLVLKPFLAHFKALILESMEPVAKLKRFKKSTQKFKKKGRANARSFSKFFIKNYRSKL